MSAARPLGARQLEMLSLLARPKTALVVTDDVARSLIKRGLAKAEKRDALIRITSDGLRALAAEADAGRLDLSCAPTEVRLSLAHVKRSAGEAGR